VGGSEATAINLQFGESSKLVKGIALELLESEELLEGISLWTNNLDFVSHQMTYPSNEIEMIKEEVKSKTSPEISSS